MDGTATTRISQRTPRRDDFGQRSRQWPEILFFSVLVAVMHLSMGLQSNVAQGNFLDTDVYSWLNRVVLLHEHGDWFDKSLPQVNPPHGHTQHWSRAFDVLLYAGALAGEPFVGFRAALEHWAVWVSPFLQVLTLLTLLVVLRPVFPDFKNALPVIALLFVGHHALLESFAVGRGDHQSLLLWCAALAMSSAARMLDGRRSWCYVTGFACALGVWVSVEFMLIIGIVQIALGLLWLRETRGHAQTMTHFSVALLIFGTLVHVAHNGPRMLTSPATDEISALYWTLFAGATLFWWLAHRLTQSGRLGSWVHKCVFATVGGLCVGMAVLVMLPNALTGPLGELDSLYERVRLSRIKEIQPIVSLGDLASGRLDALWMRALPWLGLSIPALAAAFFACRAVCLRAPTALGRLGVLNAVGLAVFIPLTCWQIRWMGYAALLCVPAAAWTVMALLDWLSRTRARWITDHGRLGVIMIFALGANVPMWLSHEEESDPLLRSATGSTLADVAEHLGRVDLFGSAPMTIMAFVDYGPELIYRTRRHHVYAMPNHRPQPGFIASYRAMSAATDAEARSVLRSLKADVILVRDHPAELGFYVNEMGLETFHRRLVAGQAPDWLTPLELPRAPDTSFRAYSFGDPVADRYR